MPPYNMVTKDFLKMVVKDDNGKISDIKIENTQTFVEQMMFYAKEYGI